MNFSLNGEWWEKKNQLFCGKSVPRSLALDLTHLAHQTRMPRVEIIVASCVAWLRCCALASVNHSPDSLCVLSLFYFTLVVLVAGFGCASASSLTLRVAFRSSNVYRMYTHTHTAYTVVSIVVLIRFIFRSIRRLFIYYSPVFIWFDVSANRLFLWIWIEKSIFVYVSERVWWPCAV